MLARGFLSLIVAVPGLVQADVLIGSWNIKHLGWNNDKAFEQVAHVANHFDLLAIQELMDTSALARLEREVEALSGEAWSSMASRDLGRSSYTEHYAFLWRESEVAYADGAVVFLDHGDVFSREPYAARFRDVETGDLFTAATVHVVYGDSVGDRLPEIAALADYWEWLDAIAQGTPRVLMGDFNLAPHHEGWAALRAKGAQPAITAGDYANLYDNLWYDADDLEPTDRGMLRFPDLLALDHQASHAHVSDHAPVYLGLHGARLALRHADGGEALAGIVSPVCIDLNDATASRLEDLPHVGPARAEAIVEGRPWATPEELTMVNGIGGGRLEAIQASGLLCGG
ncbi:helix-hairpin-helix domain-containing protein [Halomonas sp.]|uniref:helix-hairpin-helix domain-containing protein n=1 Tax=Halomonas sp. TaxID=1486246 RepID=UPI00384C62F0